MSIRFRLSLLITMLFFAAIANAIFTFWLENLGDEKLKWVNHTSEVISTTKNFLSAIKDAETGQRGYLLTHKISYLQPYHQGLAQSKEEYKKLKDLTSDNPDQQNLLLKIDEQMRHKFDELAETISLTQQGQKSKALEIVSLNKGKQFMDAIRGYLTTFIHNEVVLLEKRKGDFRENRAEITTLIFIEVVLFVGLSIFTFLFLHKNFFSPLNLLIRNAEKIEKGERLEASDIVVKGEMGHLLSVFYEMSYKIFERQRSLDHQAKHDSLTGLKNRTTVFQEIEQSVARSIEANNRTAILFMDLNSFKQINDSLGHEYGDLVLKETAFRLSASVRASDTIFRIGGDEFLIVIKNVDDINDVFGVIDKIKTEFSVPAEIKGEVIDIAVSIGVSISPDDSIKSSELIEFADVAMYASKKEHAGYKLFEKSMLKRAGDHVAGGSGKVSSE